MGERSRPTRGAWIEIGVSMARNAVHWSRPTRGAWIEMSRASFTMPMLASRPTRGAWIEIDCFSRSNSFTNRRAPHGARGLKFFLRGFYAASAVVAPHTGRVD